MEWYKKGAETDKENGVYKGICRQVREKLIKKRLK